MELLFLLPNFYPFACALDEVLVDSHSYGWGIHDVVQEVVFRDWPIVPFRRDRASFIFERNSDGLGATVIAQLLHVRTGILEAIFGVNYHVATPIHATQRSGYRDDILALKVTVIPGQFNPSRWRDTTALRTT